MCALPLLRAGASGAWPSTSHSHLVTGPWQAPTRQAASSPPPSALPPLECSASVPELSPSLSSMALKTHHLNS